MKLLYLFNGRFPSERAQSIQIAKMCTAFIEAGHEVELAASNRPTDISDNDTAYGDLAVIPITRVAVPDLVALAGKLDGVLGACIYSLQRLAFALNVRLSGHDVIYGRDPVLLWLVSWRVGKQQKLVYESHQAQYNWFVKRLLRKGVLMVVISEGIFDYYKQCGVPEAQMLIAHDGVDESFFQPTVSTAEARRRLGLSQGEKVAMYIGGFDAWKGVETFFKASEFATDVTFVVIGGNAEQVAELQTKYPRVTFFGHRPYADLAINQQAANVLVVPNTAKNDLSAKFTSPLKLFAHLTSGVPLLVSDIPSLRSVVSKEQVWFFKPDEPEDLVQSIYQVLNDSGAGQKCKSALELSRQYTWSERVKSIVSFIQAKQPR